AWYRNIASWWPHRQADNVLILRYEDMKKNLSASIDVILGFLGWSLTPLQRKNVLEYCSFAWMKTNADRFGNHEGKSRPTFQPGTFIRKGVVGDYQSMLSEQQEQRILDKARRELEPDCLTYLELF
ncbi:MAG: sulfotransferase domain-containing protein, partial [Gammaproteobacteria bacterium]|nr:sulfotransferase domain-containing protein [Gammaproteobacteria bacterium]